MSVKTTLCVVVLSLILWMGVNHVSGEEDKELFEELKGREVSLSERVARTAAQARNSWDNLITADLNGYWSTLTYMFTTQDIDKLPSFNATKLTTIAMAGHFAIICAGEFKMFFPYYLTQSVIHTISNIH